MVLVLRGRCSLWPEGARHSRGLSNGSVLLTSGAKSCVLQALGPRLVETAIFSPRTGGPLDEPVLPPRSKEHVQILAAEARWSTREGPELVLPPWLLAGPEAVSLTHGRKPLHEALAEELLVPRHGRKAVLQRLLEAIVIRALRVELVAGFWSVPGWLGALTDPVLRGALGEASDLSAVRSVQALAEHSQRSIRRLSARVKQISGARPGKLLRQLRLADVLRSLEHPAPCLSDIARAAGYADVSSFCRAFRREIGCTPAAYWRRRHGRRLPRVIHS